MPSIDAIVNRQLLRWQLERREIAKQTTEFPPPPRVVTVSRQVGSGGTEFAHLLADKLGYRWMHREVIEAICESSGYRRRMIEALDERFHSDLQVLVDALLTGQAVDHSDYRRHLFQVIFSMGELGGVVLVGRGGSFILGPLRGFHIRVVAPRDQRLRRLMQTRGLSEAAARETMEETDGARAQFIRKLFGADIDNPQHYDMILNLGALNPEDMLEPIVRAIQAKMQNLAQSPSPRK